MIKFRTMTNEPSKSAEHDITRLTIWGRFLRKTSIDELPVLLNVIKGDMSLVGPRPLPAKYLHRFNSSQKKRMSVKPGITGAAQVKGFRGETKELEDMEGRIRLDVWYIENWSFSLDLNIIFLTIWNVFRGDEKAI